MSESRPQYRVTIMQSGHGHTFVIDLLNHCPTSTKEFSGDDRDTNWQNGMRYARQRVNFHSELGRCVELVEINDYRDNSKCPSCKSNVIVPEFGCCAHCHFDALAQDCPPEYDCGNCKAWKIALEVGAEDFCEDL